MNNSLLRHRIISKIQDIDLVGFRKLSTILPKLLFKKPSSPQVLNTLHNFKLIIDPVRDNGIEQSIYYTGTYEKGTLYFLENILEKGDSFIDIGSNIGLISIFASMKVEDSGKVYAFEANPQTFEILKKNININELKNITPINIAIGATKDTGRIYDNWNINRGAASMFNPSNEEVTSYKIDIAPLDTIIDDSNKIKAIKIDVEGFEYEVLKGSKKILSREEAPILIIEYSKDCLQKANVQIDDLFYYIKEINDYHFFKSTRKKGRRGKLKQIYSVKELINNDNFICMLAKHVKQVNNLIVN